MSAIGKLNKTESEILQKIKEGFTSGQIATLRGCSVRTVEKHRSNILKKLSIESSQNSLIRYVINHI